MKLLFAMTMPYIPESTGGVESTTHEMCQALRARGIEVAVLANFRRHGAPARRFALRRFLGGGGSPLRDLSLGYPVLRCRDALAAVEAVCGYLQPDAVVVKLGRIVPLARRTVDLGIPTVLYLHNLTFGEMGGALFRHKLLLPVTTSQFMAQAVEARTGIRPEVLLQIVPPANYRTESTGEVVTFVNPTPLKGLDVALHLAARRPDIPFEFIESWPLRWRKWQLLRRQVGHLPNVRLLRRTPDMRAVYARSRIVLAPSRWEEPWGRIATEAQISGIPVIAAATGGLPEAVGPGGLLVPPEAPLSAWDDALASLWDDPALHATYSRLALEHAARPEIQPDALMDRFLALVGRGGSGAAAESS
jgi:glycosyltransferase involved in cell wall biosynthesis